jgi:hypothetical protein
MAMAIKIERVEIERVRIFAMERRWSFKVVPFSTSMVDQLSCSSAITIKNPSSLCRDNGSARVMTRASPRRPRRVVAKNLVYG